MHRTRHTFQGMIQDASAELNRLLVDLVENRIDEDDIDHDTRETIIAYCSDLIGDIDGARDQVKERELEREVEKCEREWGPADA